MVETRPLSIPVILGTVRQGRRSADVARLMVSELSRRSGVTTELIDVAALPLRVDDAGEATKEPTFAAQMDCADALVVVSPEYNHGYSAVTLSRFGDDERPRASVAMNVMWKVPALV